MLKNPNLLNQCLREAGIRPISFAYFLREYIRKKKSGKKTALLTASLKAQAELIIYHLEH